jgi:pyruvate/2-oxoglutarate dehydrogenase complex dihydrolipoamide acyltransferase (E2) component
MREVRVPEAVWADGGEPVITAWLFRDGEVVSRGAVLAELAVEKAQVELEAPCSGRLKILVDAETPITRDQAVAVIEPA